MVSIRDRILKVLQDSALVDAKHLKSLEKESREKFVGNIIDALIERGIVSDKDVLMVMSRELNIPAISMSRIKLDADTVTLVPEKLLRRHSVVPLAKMGRSLTLVVSDPSDVVAIDDIQASTGCRIELALATRRDIREALRAFYDKGEEEIIPEIEREESAEVEVIEKEQSHNVIEITAESKTAPIVKMVDLIITEAIKRRASDIHIEPQEKVLKVRYRIDGELQEAFDLPKKNQNSLLARLKIMSNMDITETRVPQDGRFRIKIENKEIDFRVSSLPLTHGNKIVMRALDKSSLSIGLEALGFLPEPLADFKTALARPYGIILVTGPTGSGKSTTLYSILNEMNTPDRNIVTIEDPVEYQVSGITQMAARADIGLDFADGLRAILRQSPDVILVGEIRDFDTADVAIKASLTGQMVLSTLHTNDSVGAITRLVNMGVEPFLVSSSLIMACAQRLLRKICEGCKKEEIIPDTVLKDLEKKYPSIRDVKKFYKGTGCSKCGNTGYKGRFATIETLLADDEIRDMITRRKSEDEIRAYLNSKNVGTLRDNAMRNFIRGWTTLEEVYRVT